MKFDIEAAERRCAAATAGPWIHVKDLSLSLACWIIAPSEPSEDFPEGYPLCDFRGTDKTADFIAHARTDLPAALALIREYQRLAEGMACDETCASQDSIGCDAPPACDCILGRLLAVGKGTE
jgi:hypothetical protein